MTVCSHCGGTDIEYDQARGDAVCTSCGSVLEDNIIVSEVTFAEQSSGASSVIGQFVSSEGSKNPLSGSGFHHGLGRDSREVTLQHAKKRLTHLGHLLKLNQHCIDSAFMFFKMALQLNLTRGRKSSIVDTACLYLVCRSEGTPHLLLDFSDVLQINVYALGRAYLKLSNALHINPPAIDPCLYIHRFAHKLELGDRTHEVSMTALRLVARMKRDWIHHGRRPAGLCGAALLVAARLHNFNRTVREVSKVVKLSEGTIRKRLGDFKDTPSSRLTIEEFLKIDLEQEHDPPSFMEAKKKTKQQLLGGEAGDSDSDEEEEDICKTADDAESEEDDEEQEEGGYGGIKMDSVQAIIAKARFNETYINMPTSTLGLSDNLDELATEAATLLAQDNVVTGDSASDDCTSGEGQVDLEDIDDKEIDTMLLSEEEVRIKSQLWFAENGDFLKEQELRREKLALIKAEKEKQRKNRPYRPRKSNKVHHQPAKTAGEAIEKMLVEKRISTKINYDVLRDLDKEIGSETQDGSDSIGSLVNISSTAGSSYPSTSGSGGSLTITKMPSTIGGRLPSLSTRKRTFSALGGSSSQSLAPKLSRLQQVGQTQTVGQILKTMYPADETLAVENREKSLMDQEQDDHLSSTYRQRTSPNTPVKVSRTKPTSSKRNKGPPGPSDLEEEVIAGGGEPEVVEESGPVQYHKEGEEMEEEGGLDDEEIEGLAYDEDPLLHSDYEDEGGDYYEEY